MFSEFKKFVLRGNVVDLAVAVVVGVAFTAMVTAFVNDLITPLIAAIFGKPNFGGLHFTVHHSLFKYGSFLNALLVVPHRGDRRLLRRRRAAGHADEAVEPGAEGGAQARDALVPRVPERHPGGGAPLRVLHVRGDGGGLETSRRGRCVSRRRPLTRVLVLARSLSRGSGGR